MHPSKFFNECNLRTGIDTFEIYDKELKDKLSSIHPLNFIKTKITLPVYQIDLSYMTDKGNYKNVIRYAVMDSESDDEYVDFWADMFTRDYNNNHPEHQMIDCRINSIMKICEPVLPIG